MGRTVRPSLKGPREAAMLGVPRLVKATSWGLDKRTCHARRRVKQKTNREVWGWARSTQGHPFSVRFGVVS